VVGRPDACLDPLWQMKPLSHRDSLQ
jgi:hypothetical protein